MLEKRGCLHWNHSTKKWQERENPDRIIPKNEQPLLVFIHGTASSTARSFSDLWFNEYIDGNKIFTSSQQGGNPKIKQSWHDFVDTFYKGRVYALEHDTFKKSPARNANDLVKQLAKGQMIHLVSHSRGGLVGELICLSSGGEKLASKDPISQADIKRFTSAYERSDAPSLVINDLKQLNKTLKTKVPVVTRFVRVACPIRGTTLASGRLDIYLSILATTVQLLACVTHPELSTAVGILKGVAIAAAKKRIDISSLPGLESMIPDRGFIRLLNDYGSKVDSPLSIIAGNAQMDGLSRQTLWVALSNSYYWKKNDFVVESESMQGGLRRNKSVSYLLDTNKDVNHFSYFSNERTVNRLYAELKGDSYVDSKEVLNRGHTPRTAEKSIPVRPIKASGLTIIIPAFAGSYLHVNGKKVWLQSDSIAKGELALLDLKGVDESGSVGTGDGWINSRYQQFASYLEEEHHQQIISFCYDWRLSTQKNAEIFKHDIQSILSLPEYQSLPVKIVAHSTGGYIAVNALHRFTTFRNILVKKRDMKLFLIGMPFNGTYHALELLQGVSPFLPYLSMIDKQHSQQELKVLFASFPGLIDMLPAGYEGANEALHKQLNTNSAFASRIHYVAGTYPRTPVSMSSSEEFVTSSRGDGSARWDHIPSWISTDRVWYLDKALHGNLLAMPSTFPALPALIITGNTHQLTHTQPLSRASRSLKHARLKPSKIALLYPNTTDIENTILRGSTVTIGKKQQAQYRAHIRIVNGDLCFTEHPILVGHYLRDSIKSAEAIIDNELGGMLTDLYRKNRYPGKIGSTKVVTRRDNGQEAFGAVIVGLGALGSLSVRTLRETLKEAFVEYGLHQRELLNNCNSKQDNRMATPQPLVLSSLLIGTGSGGLSVDDSVLSLLRALTDANEDLVEMYCEPIARLDIVELYEDVAITAARSLKKIQELLDYSLSIEPLIVAIAGVQKRAASVERDSWWQHIQVIADDKGRLTFSPLVNRAGMDTTVLATQTELIDNLINQVTQGTVFNRLFSQTLFRLLIPNGLKEQVLDDNGMVLLLNKRAAVYPWEMLIPSNNDKGQSTPFATDIGFIRKLHTSVDTTHPTAINHKAMIVGDPISTFVELPGAQQEANKVKNILLESVFDVSGNVLIRANAVDIVSKIMSTSVQILHLAGHGIYIPPNGSYKDKLYKNGLAGMVLGDGVYLTEKEVKQLEYIPELVFINCCHLGKMVSSESMTTEDNAILGHSRSAFAANLETAFIEAGAKCVVAAGWEVDDAAALVFATHFYQRMIYQGESFGEACKQARIAVFKQHQKTNTWGAYQCYGNPSFRFNKNHDSTDYGGNVSNFHASWELVVWSKNICAKQSLSATELKKIAKEVRNRADGLPDIWRQEGRVLEAIANVFAKTGIDTLALKWYQKATECGDSSVSISALEDKIQLLIQVSEDMFRFYSQFRKTVKVFDKQYIDPAMRLIDNLLELGVTKQRSMLKAAAHRHYADTLLQDNKKEAYQHLKISYDLYLKESNKAFDLTGKYDAMPLLNAASIWLGFKGDSISVLNRYIRQLKRLNSQLELTRHKHQFVTREALLRCVLIQRLLLVRKNNDDFEYDDLLKLYLKLLVSNDEHQVKLVLKPIRFLYTYLTPMWCKGDQCHVVKIKDLHDEIDSICKIA